jgi:hypothetical protein
MKYKKKGKKWCAIAKLFIHDYKNSSKNISYFSWKPQPKFINPTTIPSQQFFKSVRFARRLIFGGS